MATDPRGRGAAFYMKAQSDFVTAASGNFLSRAFHSESIARNRNIVNDEEISPGLANERDQTDPGPGFHRPAGQLVVPLDFNQLHTWLHMGLGAVTPSGAGPYTWVWSSGVAELPAYGFAFKVRSDHYKRVHGAKLNGMTIVFDKAEGFRQATLDIMARQVAKVTSSPVGTPVALPTRAKHVAMNTQILVNDVLTAKVLGGEISFSNNLEIIDEVEEDTEGLATDMVAGDFTCSLRLRCRAVTDALFDLPADHTAPVTGGVKVLFEQAAGASLQIALPRCFGSIPHVPIGGPGRLEFELNLEAKQLRHDTSPVAAAAFTLVNAMAALTA